MNDNNLAATDTVLARAKQMAERMERQRPEREVTNERPAEARATQAQTTRLLAALAADERCEALTTAERLALQEAVRRHANKSGEWFIREKKWAAEARVCDRTIRRMTAKAHASGLIIVTTFREADQAARWQGANTYALDPELVAAASHARDAGHCVRGAGQVVRHRGRVGPQNVSTTAPDPDRLKNENPPGTARDEGDDPVPGGLPSSDRVASLENLQRVRSEWDDRAERELLRVEPQLRPPNLAVMVAACVDEDELALVVEAHEVATDAPLPRWMEPVGLWINWVRRGEHGDAVRAAKTVEAERAAEAEQEAAAAASAKAERLAAEAALMPCPECKGNGVTVQPYSDRLDLSGEPLDTHWARCPRCNGAKRIRRESGSDD
jgi:hypothetical protein